MKLSFRRALGRPFVFALGVLSAMLAPAASRAADDADKIRSIVDETVRPLMARHDIPGMSVALTVDGRAHVLHYGVASRQSQAPVTESTIFEVGSVSKMFTATLAAYAQAIGKLSLDDHPGRYVPGVKGRPIDQPRCFISARTPRVGCRCSSRTM